MPEVFLRSKKKVKSKLFLLLVGRETKMSRLLTKVGFKTIITYLA